VNLNPATTKMLTPDANKAATDVDTFATAHPESAGWRMVWSRSGQRVGAYHPSFGLVDDPASILTPNESNESRAVRTCPAVQAAETELEQVRALIAAAVERRDTAAITYVRMQNRHDYAKTARAQAESFGEKPPKIDAPTLAEVEAAKYELTAAEDDLRGSLANRLAAATSRIGAAQTAARRTAQP
jgi:hypothetical protein